MTSRGEQTSPLDMRTFVKISSGTESSIGIGFPIPEYPSLSVALSGKRRIFRGQAVEIRWATNNDHIRRLVAEPSWPLTVASLPLGRISPPHPLRNGSTSFRAVIIDFWPQSILEVRPSLQSNPAQNTRVMRINSPPLTSSLRLWPQCDVGSASSLRSFQHLLGLRSARGAMVIMPTGCSLIDISEAAPRRLPMAGPEGRLLIRAGGRPSCARLSWANASAAKARDTHAARWSYGSVARCVLGSLTSNELQISPVQRRAT